MADRKRKPISGKAGDALEEFDQLTTAHEEFVTKLRENRRAYEGVLEKDSEADQFLHAVGAPYCEHIVETTVASMLDEELRFRIQPANKVFYSEGEVDAAQQAAKGHEILLRQQMKADRFNEKTRPLVVQERYAGLSVAKEYWRESARKKKKWVTDLDPEIGLFPVQRLTEEPETLYDGPCTEIVDVEDFFWDDQATELDKCGLLAHRIWPTYAEAREMQRRGTWKNVSELSRKDRDFSSNYNERDEGDPNIRRGRIEVLEIWRREDSGKMRVYTIGNREVVLAERDNPFHHGMFPFVGFVGQSRPFRIVGRPQVEKLKALQAMLWTIQNQRIDNLMMINNAIAIIASDVEDEDAYEFYPGARWIVDRPDQVEMWSPNAVPAQVSIPSESIFKADMQNLAGGFPFTSTSEASTVDANTATEASLVANLAQRSIIGAKRQLYDAYRRIGQMKIELNQQFVREPVYALVLGADERMEQMQILPQMVQEAVLFDIEPMTESLMRQERRSEALSLFQALAPTVQMAMMTGAALNVRKIIEHVLEAFDIQNTEAWFAPPQVNAGQPGLPPGQGTPPSPQENGGGVTNPNLAAGPQAPSNANSMAPAQMMQQFLSANNPSNV